MGISAKDAGRLARFIQMMLNNLPEHDLEYCIERASIREYDGGSNREDAECGALEDLKQRGKDMLKWLRFYDGKNINDN